MKHDEKKIEEIKNKFVENMTYGGRGNHLDDTMPVDFATDWFIAVLKQYAEHMIQQEYKNGYKQGRLDERM